MSSSSKQKQAQEWYERGNALRKEQKWGEAINAYTEALEFDPQSPAGHARDMLMEILEFYCKDNYNP